MEAELEQRIQTAIRVAGLLFSRGKVSGATGNISFRYRGQIFISAGGSCFGWLKETDFAVIDQEGIVVSERNPSKEYPLHKIIYDAKPGVQAVIHTHSFYTTLWSCLCEPDCSDVFTDITPYLKMKVGTIGTIPQAPPGSEDLFGLLKDRVHRSEGYLLANHGGVIGGEDLEAAFFGIEELEETARIHYYIKQLEMKKAKI